MNNMNNNSIISYNISSDVSDVDAQSYYQNEVIFKHNFCESRLQENEGPEYWNAGTSLFISLVPFFFKKPKTFHFQQFAVMLIINGPSSFYYHYSLSWLGKHLDEITMFMANYYLICGFSSFYGIRLRHNYILLNSAILPLYIAFNTLPQYDALFAFVYSSYCIFTLYLLFDITRKSRCFQQVTYNLGIATIGATSWVISETICNHITQYGHIVWHILFPLGIYRVIMILDRIIDDNNILDKENGP